MIDTARNLPDQEDDTIVRTMDLPDGQDYAVHADLNIVELSSRLDAAGRERALAEAGVR